MGAKPSMALFLLRLVKSKQKKRSHHRGTQIFNHETHSFLEMEADAQGKFAKVALLNGVAGFVFAVGT